MTKEKNEEALGNTDHDPHAVIVGAAVDWVKEVKSEAEKRYGKDSEDGWRLFLSPCSIRLIDAVDLLEK